MHSAGEDRPIIVCPLRYEWKRLRRVVHVSRFDWLCCGPGAAGVRRAAEVIGETRRVVILAGLAGGLTQRAKAGTALFVAEVVDPVSHERWRPAWPAIQSSAAMRTCIITSTGVSVTTTAEKASLAARSGADAVDLESVSFAKAATARGWRWGIVRGISDGPDQSLPQGIDQWVGANGRTNLGSVLMSLARQPMLIPQLRIVASNGKAALRSACTLIASAEC